MMHTIDELAQKLRTKEISSVELTTEYLQKAQQSTLNSYITICEDIALEQAKQADKKLASGNMHPLCGIPYAHKDLFNSIGVKTTAASKILENFISPYNATVSQNLEDAGAVLLGKANLDEFAMGSSNETSFFGVVKNPHNTNKIVGGSSGGSAASIAADECVFATGTDTGGSIRQPAAMCGISGLKPTYGRVSRYGIIAYASSLDQAGPMAKTAKDCGIILNTMASFDEKDSTSANVASEDFSAKDIDIKNITIGVPQEYFAQGLDNEVATRVQHAIKEYEKMGATIKEISLPHLKDSIPAYYIIAPCEASSNLSRYDGVRYGYRADNPKDLEDLYIRSRSEGFGAEVQKRIMVGAYALSEGYYDAYYLKAQKVRRLISEDFTNAFQEVDVIMGPVAPTTAWDIGSIKDSTQMYLSDIYTLGVNLAGLPAMSIPCGLDTNAMPIGLQIIGKPWSEADLVSIADSFQNATDFHTITPNGGVK
jgi:aspartyl-tRNA(Asn)/glutamyl-tRNA(Gln) amidotransferase subunit A